MGIKTRTIQDLLKENRRLKQLADKDFLTGLFNRRKLEEDIERYTKLHERHNITFSIIMLDINNFKEINDTKGHKTGDKVLKQIANILQKCIRKTDRVYRLGGDEFILIVSHHTAVDIVINRVQHALNKINIETCIGHYYICKDCLELIDKRMYEEKRK